MYIYMHMCTYIYVSIYIYIYICVCVCVFRHIHRKKHNMYYNTIQHTIHVYTNVFIYIQSTKLHPADLAAIAAMILIWLQGQRSDICGWHSQFPRHFQADRQFGAGQMFKYIHFLKTSAIASVCDGGRMAATGAVRRVAWEQRFGLKRLGTHDFTKWIGPIG